MTTDTQNAVLQQVWALLNQLRGLQFTRSDDLVPQVIGFIFLKYLSEHAGTTHSAKYGDIQYTIPDGVGWSYLETSPDIDESVLVHVIRAIEEHPENQGFNGVFTALGLSDHTLGRDIYSVIIRYVSLLDFSGLTENDFIEVVEAIMDRAPAGVKSRGEFTTPAFISSLMVRLLNPTPGSTIYDPACGLGGSLISAYRQSLMLSAELPPFLFGQEINRNVANLATANLVLHGIGSGEIRTGNTLIDTQFKNSEGRVRQFDFVVTNPPWNYRLDEETLHEVRYAQRYRYEMRGHLADGYFIQHVAASLSESGRGVMLLPRGILFNTIFKELREGLINDGLIESIVTLPSQLMPGVSVAPFIMTLSRYQHFNRPGQILLVDGDAMRAQDNRLSDDDYSQRIAEIVSQGRIEPGSSFLVGFDELATSNFDLSPQRFAETLEPEKFFASNAQWHPLSELSSEILQGTHTGKEQPGGVPVIRGRDLSSVSLSVDDLATVSMPSEVKNQVLAQTGDILIQRIGTRPHTMVVSEELRDTLVADTVFVVRLHPNYLKLANFVVEFFNSDNGQNYLTSILGGATIPTVRISALRELKVPIPDDVVLALINEIRQVEGDLAERLRVARDLRLQVYSSSDIEIVKERLSSLSTSTQMLAASLKQSEDFSFQIRNNYPFLLAYSYRTLDPIIEASQRYQEQLRVAENMLAFLGSIGLALAAHITPNSQEQQPDITLEFLRNSWKGGISPGSWRDMAIKSAQAIRANDSYTICGEFASLWFKGNGQRQSDFAEDIRQLVERINDFKHNRGPRTPDEFHEKIGQSEEILRRLLEKLDFFVKYPIRQVQHSDTDWRTEKAVLTTLVYQGDHPGLPQERINFPHAVPLNHLYLQLSDTVWISLYPLISVHYCPSCQTRETYMIDYWNTDRPRLTLKSFERGHTHENDSHSKQIADDMEHYIHQHFV